MTTPSEAIINLRLTLPTIEIPFKTCLPFLVARDVLYVSGQLPFGVDGSFPRGSLGREITASEGRQIARQCGVNILAQIQAALGSVNEVEQILKLTVFVASAPGFNDQSNVAHGASDLMVEVFGAAGYHARSAIGVAELPLGAPVEIEAMIAVRRAKM
jgi:enamine deaminase RidA (YjgF/YER057c/UK114 family)